MAGVKKQVCGGFGSAVASMQEDEMNRREFCSSLVAVAAAGPVGALSKGEHASGAMSSSALLPAGIRETTHRIYFEAAQNMGRLDDATVDLVVTSPPYPMIEMWDSVFSAQSPAVAEILPRNPDRAFELMHQELDKVWKECFRLLKDGGFMCVNIGDATRTINKDFQLYNNHSRIVSSCNRIGFVNLPNILWRKQTNAPNKFMGSGMLPCGAYVTLEHEWILIFRKGEKRVYKSEGEKNLRRCSAFFWEERNKWFSDLWEIKGTKQTISNSKTRERNASFPVEIPFRLVNMYSQMGDTVLDPFLGLGTTTVAAMMSNRNSIGFEIDSKLESSINDFIVGVSVDAMTNIIQGRLENHRIFVKERADSGKDVKYKNRGLNCPVMTSQETDIVLTRPNKVEKIKDAFSFRCDYQPL